MAHGGERGGRGSTWLAAAPGLARDVTRRHAGPRGVHRIRGARVREFGIFAASTLLYQGARFLFSLAAARSLAAEDFTAWALVVALLVYAPSLLLGVTNGMSRELPMLIGRGANSAAERTVDAAWAATTAAVVIVLLGGVIVATAASSAVSSSLLVGVLASGTIVFGTQQFVMRSRLRFGAASAQQAAFGVLTATAAIVLALSGNADFRTAALLYGTPLMAAILLGIAIAAPPTPPRLDIDEIRRLARIGFPIMLAGLAFSLFVTLDRWMAITLLGPQRAAPYALASLIAAAMLVIPSVVSQQTYPRMAIARGRGAMPNQLRRMARRQGLLAALLIAPIALAMIPFAVFGIPLVLPAYEAAIPSVIVLSLGFVILGFLTGYGNYLNVVGGQWRYLSVQLTGVVSAVALMFIGGRLFGLVGIALGMAGSHLVYGVMLRAVAKRTGLVGAEPLTPAPS